MRHLQLPIVDIVVSMRFTEYCVTVTETTVRGFVHVSASKSPRASLLYRALLQNLISSVF